MKIAVEGCAHGELDLIYDTLSLIESRQNIKVDLLICCGDFQAVRNEHDLESVAVPLKYRQMNSFYKYYSGEKTAPVLTIFVGGNHEASNHLQELEYGGWVAPNIYYLGTAGVITIGGLRIAGLSGIYKGYSYRKGLFNLIENNFDKAHYEKYPFTEDDKRSVYHVREVEITKLSALSSSIDIFVSHDWPQGIDQFGDKKKLLEAKKFLKEEKNEYFGNPNTMRLLKQIQPSLWFAAHMHVKFPAIVPHDNSKVTKFLALGKPNPRGDWLQIIQVPCPYDSTNYPLDLQYDLEWLLILAASLKLGHPVPASEWMKLRPTPEQIVAAWEMIQTSRPEGLKIPNNFVITVVPHGQNNQPTTTTNPQTPQFMEFLKTFWPIVESTASTIQAHSIKNNEEIPLDDDLMDNTNNNNNAHTSNVTQTNDEEIALELDDEPPNDQNVKKVKLNE